MAGGGPIEDAIKEAARGVPGIELLGHVDHARALQLMDDASFVVVPSLWDEPFGLAVVEAMARGRPVLVTNLGEPADRTAAACTALGANGARSISCSPRIGNLATLAACAICGVREPDCR